jgi:predicted dinucleotide-binding enzyme
LGSGAVWRWPGRGGARLSLGAAGKAATGFPGPVVGLDNAGAAVAGDVVVVAVPWQGHRDLLASLAGPVAGPLAG